MLALMSLAAILNCKWLSVLVLCLVAARQPVPVQYVYQVCSKGNTATLRDL